MSTRALTQRESENVRRRLRDLVDQYDTQTEAARKLGISQQVLSRILSGDPAGYYVAKKLAGLLKITLEQLLNSNAPVLDELVASNPGRWSTWTVSAVRVTPGIEQLNRAAVERLLDKAESVLTPVIRPASSK